MSPQAYIREIKFYFQDLFSIAIMWSIPTIATALHIYSAVLACEIKNIAFLTNNMTKKTSFFCERELLITCLIYPIKIKKAGYLLTENFSPLNFLLLPIIKQSHKN